MPWYGYAAHVHTLPHMNEQRLGLVLVTTRRIDSPPRLSPVTANGVDSTSEGCVHQGDRSAVGGSEYGAGGVELGSAAGVPAGSEGPCRGRVRATDAGLLQDPQVIGWFVDVTASLEEVVVFCDGQVVARHERSWAKQAVVTDPVHAATAQRMRQALAEDRHRRQGATRRHTDGHAVALRALPDYDALFGVDFEHPSTKAE